MMESPGARLKRVRLEKGISLEEAHKKTKMHINILRAIEEDNLINFSPIFIKGFLKIYCKFLNVDPKDFIADYKEPQNVVSVGRANSFEQRVLQRIKVSSPDAKPFRPNIKLIVKIVLAILCIMILFKVGKAISTKRSIAKKVAQVAPAITGPSKAKKAEKAKPPTTKEAKEVKPPIAGIPTQIRTLQTPTQKQKTTPLIIKLGIRAKEDCWVQLRLDGRMVFQNVIKKGRYENWQANSKMELSLGNAGVVDLEVNGKLISNLGRRGQVIKNIVINQEGLIIPR